LRAHPAAARDPCRRSAALRGARNGENIGPDGVGTVAVAVQEVNEPESSVEQT
jgi:hypothetical protein